MVLTTTYSDEKTATCTIEYHAICIEHGEQYYMSFFTPKRYSKAELLEIGKDLASLYGGECIKVTKA